VETVTNDRKTGTAPKRAGSLRSVVSVGLGLALGALAGVVLGLLVGAGIAVLLGIL
jgi:ABC-type nitrate/sulfonate/bicarbonate transport system permease component